jgi:ribosome-associated heat shock protein Hsp15
MDRVRVDKWLWAARFYKTRGAATEAVLAGHVRVSGERAKPAKEIRIGDRLEIRRGEVRWTIVVTGIADRRGPAIVAATLYDETSESLAERERQRLERRVDRPLGADLGARPTKRFGAASAAGRRRSSRRRRNSATFSSYGSLVFGRVSRSPPAFPPGGLP